MSHTPIALARTQVLQRPQTVPYLTGPQPNSAADTHLQVRFLQFLYGTHLLVYSVLQVLTKQVPLTRRIWISTVLR